METRSVRRVVHEVRLRLARNLILRSLCVSIFWGALAFLPALVLHRFFSPPFHVLWLSVGAMAAALAAGAVLAVRSFPTPLAAAVTADKSFGLREKLSSALFAGPIRGPVGEAFLRRAETAADRVTTRGAIPFRPPLEGKLLPLPLLASALLFLLVPDMDIFGVLARREEEQQAKKDVLATARDLKRRVRDLEKKGERLSFEGAKAVVEDMEQVTKLLERHTSDGKEALARLSDLEEKLRERQGKIRARVGENAFKPKEGGSSSGSALVKKIRRAMKEGGGQKAAKALFDQLKSMKDAFAGGEMSAEEMRRMARELLSLTRSFELPPELLEKLRKLARALESGAKKGGGSKFEFPPPELDFTMEELLELLKNLKEEDFLNDALDEVQGTRQTLIEKLRICPYCKKGLKHPWEGGTPLPGMGPGGEPGVGYI